MILNLSAVSLIIVNLMSQLNADGLIEVFKWKQMDYYNRGNNAISTGSIINYPTSYTIPNSGTIYFLGQYHGVRNKRQYKYESNGIASYIPYNNVPMGATHYRGRLFVTMPRRRVGIPSTLNYIDLKRDGNQESPKLIAYPDFEINQFQTNSGHLVSVYRTSADACGRLWFTDTGMLEYPDNFMQIQRPSVWVINLHTNEVIRRFEIPEYVVIEGRGLVTITPDTDKGCDKTFAYIPDLVNSKLYVYSLEYNRMWSFGHNYFHFDPIYTDLNIGGQMFSWNDGIFSVSLGPRERDGTRNIFFHALASVNEFVVNNEVLQQERNAQRENHGKDFRLLGGRGDKRQSSRHQYDPRTGVLFYAEIQRNGVGCWNIRKPFSAAYHGTVDQNEQTMIYPSDLTIDEDGIIWVVTNSVPIFIYSTLDTNNFNFRIWKQSTVAAVNNTVCA